LPQYRLAREERKQAQMRVSSQTDQELDQSEHGDISASSTTSSIRAAAVSALVKARGKRTKMANVDALLRSSIVPMLRDRMTRLSRAAVDGRPGSGASRISASVYDAVSCGVPEDYFQASNDSGQRQALSGGADNHSKLPGIAEGTASSSKASSKLLSGATVDNASIETAVATSPLKAGEEGRISPTMTSRVSAEEKELAMELLLLSPRPQSVERPSLEPCEKALRDTQDGGYVADNVKEKRSCSKKDALDTVVTPSERSPAHQPVALSRSEEDRCQRVLAVSCAACEGRMVLHRCGKREKPIDYEAIERAETERRQLEEEEKQRRRIEKRRINDARRREARKKKKAEEERKRREEEKMKQLEAEKLKQAKIREQCVRSDDAEGNGSTNGMNSLKPSFSPLKSHSATSVQPAASSGGPQSSQESAVFQRRQSHGFFAGRESSPKGGNDKRWSAQAQSPPPPPPKKQVFHNDMEKGGAQPPTYFVESASSKTCAAQDDPSRKSYVADSHAQSSRNSELKNSYLPRAQSQKKSRAQAKNNHDVATHSESRNIPNAGSETRIIYETYSQSNTTNQAEAASKYDAGAQSYYVSHSQSAYTADRSAPLSTCDALEALAGLANSMPAAVAPPRASHSHNFTSGADNNGYWKGDSYRAEHSTGRSHFNEEASADSVKQSHVAYTARIPSYDQIRAGQYYQQPSGGQGGTSPIGNDSTRMVAQMQKNDIFHGDGTTSEQYREQSSSTNIHQDPNYAEQAARSSYSHQPSSSSSTHYR